MRHPLPVNTDKNFSPDRHTRVLLFVGNLDFAAPEIAPAIEVRFSYLAGGQQRALVLKPETVRVVPGLTGIGQLTVRLPDELAAGGDVQVSITAGGVASNTATLRIEPATAAH
jgi:hypothetical protein